MRQQVYRLVPEIGGGGLALMADVILVGLAMYKGRPELTSEN